MLGDMDLKAGRRESAIAHFNAAKGSNSEAGVNANRELARMDPLQYLQIQVGLDQAGKAHALLKNTAPVTLGNITLQVLYLDANDQRRQIDRKLKRKLDTGKSVQIPLGLGGYQSYADMEQRLRVSISNARALN